MARFLISALVVVEADSVEAAELVLALVLTPGMTQCPAGEAMTYELKSKPLPTDLTDDAVYALSRDDMQRLWEG